MQKKVNPYVLENGTLWVNTPALTQDDPRFDKACRDLLDMPETSLVVDLSHVRVITSTFIGILAVTYIDAKSAGKNLLIRAPAKVLDVFRLAGFGEENATLEEVPYSTIQ